MYTYLTMFIKRSYCNSLQIIVSKCIIYHVIHSPLSPVLLHGVPTFSYCKGTMLVSLLLITMLLFSQCQSNLFEFDRIHQIADALIAFVYEIHQIK